MTNMNKNFSILLIMVTVLTVQTTAQIGPVIRTNLTGLLAGRYSLGTELVLRDQFSLGLDVDYIARNTSVIFVEVGRPGEPLFGGGDTQKRGVILEPQIRWYPGKTAGQGTYVTISGFLGYSRYTPVDWFWGYDPMEWRGRGALSSWDISEGLSDSFSTPTWGALGPKTRARASSRTTPRFPYAQDFVCLLVYVWASMLAVICKVDLTKWGSSVLGFCVGGVSRQECQA